MADSGLIFGYAVSSAESEAQACLLIESIRAFGGRYAGSAVWVFSQRDAYHLSERALAELQRLEARPVAYDLDLAVRGLPFAGKVLAAAAAEEMARGQADLLVWLDPDSIIFQEPAPLILEKNKLLGCRPVDHILIGSPYDQPADAFWSTVYRTCGVSQESLFPITTSADQIRIRPYINAGLLVVRPETRLLQGWQERLGQVMKTGIFEPFFEQNNLTRIFLHQAILTGVILSTLSEGQIQILPHRVNYPLHMHQHYPRERRPARMNDLISGRYDMLFHDPEWPQQIAIDEPLRGWLARHLVTYGLASLEDR